MASRFRATYEPSPLAVRAVREEIARIAQECGLDELAVQDVRVAVSEAATNAVLHGRPASGAGAAIQVSAELVDHELLVDVTDTGDGMRPRRDSPGIGLGLPLMARLSKRMDICDAAPGTRIRLAFACPNGE